ncbi:SDR family NAD(P)-dependent oxidoreductase [Salinispira pacifica]
MNNDLFYRRYGSWAVIAGGSEGIGAEFASQLAHIGLNLVLVARRSELLKQSADAIRAEYLVEVRTFVLDLSRQGDVEYLIDQTADIEVGLLVCNVALSPIGRFLEVPRELHMQLIDLNCRTPAALSYAFGERMVERGRGAIIFLSSMGSFQGAELVGHYSASKAYLRVLAESLWIELRPLGVDVLVSCAGPVRTPTYLQDSPRHPRWLTVPEMDAAPVVSRTLRALGGGPVTIPGLINRVTQFLVSRLLSRRTAVLLTSAGTRAMYPQFKRRGRR